MSGEKNTGNTEVLLSSGELDDLLTFEILDIFSNNIGYSNISIKCVDYLIDDKGIILL